ncbi:MAG: TadE/TadG family type IV pilus assembly protein [Chloroflexota bacterium]
MPLPARVRARSLGRSTATRPDELERGQSLVEFALLIPLFLALLMGLIEFAFAFNALLNTNYASRGAGLIAAQVGNASAADCFILNEVELKMGAPADKRQISRVDIQRTNPSGSAVYATSAYQRSGSMTCTLTSGAQMSVPYSASSSGYPPSQRCTVLPPAGCTTLTPARTTVDTIAVQITYVYPWQTPLKALMPLVNGSLSGTGFTMVQRNVFRMEPTL